MSEEKDEKSMREKERGEILWGGKWEKDRREKRGKESGEERANEKNEG